MPWAITVSRRPPTLQTSTFHLQGSRVPLGCLPVKSLSPRGAGPKTPWSRTLQILKVFSTFVFHFVHLDRARSLRPALQIIGIYRHYSMADQCAVRLHRHSPDLRSIYVSEDPAKVEFCTSWN